VRHVAPGLREFRVVPCLGDYTTMGAGLPAHRSGISQLWRTRQRFSNVTASVAPGCGGVYVPWPGRL